MTNAVNESLNSSPRPADSADVHFLELHGDTVAYRDSGRRDGSGAGDGEVLLLIHGMAASSGSWRAVTDRLAGDFRVIAPDLLGHGRSDKPRTDYSLGALAVWLRDLLDELAIERVTVVGQSLGGGIAMQFAHQHRNRCERVVLIGSGGLESDLSWPLRLLSAPGAEWALPVLAPSAVLRAGNTVGTWLSTVGLHSPRGAELWNTYASLMDGDARHANLQTLRSVVENRAQSVGATHRRRLTAQMPVLLIWGEDDVIIPVSRGYAAHRSMLGSRLTVLPGVGHLPHAEAPAAVAHLVAEFAATSGRRSALITRC